MNPEQYARREMRLAALAGRMKRNGFRINLPLLAERLDEGEQERARGMKVLKEFGFPLENDKGEASKAPQRTKAGQEALRRALIDLGGEKFFEKAVKVTEKTGQISTSGDDMNALIAYATKHREFAESKGYEPQRIIELATVIGQLSGIRTVYQTVETHRVGDRVHPEFSMIQASGRWSATDPGVTVMGKRGGRAREREIFLSEDGEVMLTVDLSQVDMRVVAAHCQDTAYMDMFQPGRDPHTETAIVIWNDPGRREDAKPCNHGTNYGMGPTKLADTYGLPLKTAYEYMNTRREKFPRLESWLNEIRDKVSQGQMIDNGFGRMMRAHPRSAWTEGPAQVGQGGTRDIVAEGFLRLPTEMHPHMRASIHDEGAFSVPENDVDRYREILMEAFELPGGFKPWFLHDAVPVPIFAGTSAAGHNWGACYVK